MEHNATITPATEEDYGNTSLMRRFFMGYKAFAVTALNTF